MKKIINKILTGAGMLALTVASVGVVSLGSTVPVSAECDSSELSISSGADCGQGNGQPTDLFNGDQSMFKRITDVMLFIIGAISVIMLIVGGIRYVVSGGDQGAVQSAKNTILYAIVGVIVAILAYAVVSFVTQSFVAQ
jgi:hypothetical protein